ncbi:DUF222 domain-containing protein [Nocardia sp. NPDC051030]|uniref:HNH endonuclease signature motif containing protein n=1 Tax=Nocardia sp. NPDC051030 TaxID=3155162 RepID=UPI0034181404
MSSNREVLTASGAGTLATAVNALLDTSLTALPESDLTALLHEIETSTRQLAALGHRLLVEACERSLPQRVGAGSPVRFLEETLRLSHADAIARVNAAKHLGTWHDVSGRALAPMLAHTANAQAAGEISADHARVIAKITDRIPHLIPREDREAAEQILVELARSASPDDLIKVGARILDHLDPDGTLTDDSDRARLRGIVIGRQRADGMSPIKGELTPSLRALLDPVFAKLARPGMCNPEDPQSPWVADDSVPREQVEQAAQRDHRSAAQRNHDALQALLRPEMGPTELGSHRGLPVSTVITMSLAELESAAGVVTTASGGTVSIPAALKLAEKALPFLALFDHAGMPLHLGRGQRLANPAQRLALIAAERGCTRPGCNAPATLTAVHHVSEWADGGNTDIENLTLACDHCHALVNDGPDGWKTVKLGADSQFPGRTAWIAPAHIDPTGTPRVNHRHHSKEQLALAKARIRVREERDARAAWFHRRTTAQRTAALACAHANI